MANEITIALSMSASKGGASINTVGASGPASATYTMTGNNMISGTQFLLTAGTTYALDLASVTAPYRAYIQNMGGSAVNIDKATPVPSPSMIELGAGDECLLVVPTGVTIYLKPVAANALVYVALCEK
jgi:hypothetical protein